VPGAESREAETVAGGRLKVAGWGSLRLEYRQNHGGTESWKNLRFEISKLKFAQAAESLVDRGGERNQRRNLTTDEH
jgi:hypothetical protein